MSGQGIPWWRAVVLAAVGAVLAWQVATHSLVAYFAGRSPETALRLSPTDPRALLILADRRLAQSQAPEPAQQSGQPAATQPASKTQATEDPRDRLKAWAELPFKTLDKPIDAADRPTAATAPSRPTGPSPETAEEVRRWVELALSNDPLSARAATILGQLAHLAGDQARVEKFFRAAAGRSIRESLAVYWLMRKSYEERDYAAAFGHADALMRTRAQAETYVIPILVRMAERKTSNKELTEALLGNPPWRSVFLRHLAQKASDPRAALELLLAIKATATPPTPGDLQAYVHALIERKQYELAYFAWLQFLPPEQLTSTGFLFNGSFEVKPSGLPFDWVLNEGAGVTIDIVERPDSREGQHALMIRFGLGRVDFRGVQQVVMLAPGTYEFTGKYKGEIVGKRGLVWRVTCAGTPKQIGESAMVTGASSRWRDIEFTFTVPEADCRAQQVRLELDARMASEQLVSGSIWYDELRIGRADKVEGPENGRSRR